MPWRNGGGLTRELHVAGSDPFDWRLSAATISGDGPFSSFPGIDRILVLLQGDGVQLRFGDDRTSTVLDRPGAACAFAGERPVDAALLGGPTVDLNLMWRRERYSAVLHDGPGSAADVTVVHIAAGSASAHESSGQGQVRLGRGDSAWWERDDVVGIAAAGRSTVIRFELTAR
ncbi:MAG: HutD family protein [Ilumatobacteraceae bacterium]